MAITFVEKAQNFTTGNVSFSFTNNASDNSLLGVVFLGMASGNYTISNVTYGGQALTEAVSRYQDTGVWEHAVSIWYLVNPPTGANTLSADFGGEIGTIVSTYEGVVQTSPKDQHNSA